MWESLYRSTKMPVVPMYGLFPVKLRTHIGAPIYPEAGVTPEQLSARVVAAVEQMICQHQVLPATLSQVRAIDPIYITMLDNLCNLQSPDIQCLGYLMCFDITTRSVI